MELSPGDLPTGWDAMGAENQWATRQIRDDWIWSRKSAILSVPSVVSGERNILFNPGHPDFEHVIRHQPLPFDFDPRLVGETAKRIVLQ